MIKKINNLTLYKEKIPSLLSLILAILFSIGMTHVFFQARNLYNDIPYLYIDHAFFLSYGEYFGEYIIEQFKSGYGYLNLLYSGAPFLSLYPIGELYLIYFVHILGFDYIISYKIVLFCSMVYVSTIPYYLTAKAGAHPVTRFFSVIFFWIGMQSFFLTRFSTGSIQFHLGSASAFSFLVYTEIKLRKLYYGNEHHGKITYIPRGFVAKSIILLFLSVFMNYMTGVFIFGAVLIVLIFDIIKEKGISDYIKGKIKAYMLIAIWTVFLFSFWLIPNIFIHFPNGKFALTYFLYTYEYSIGYNADYLARNYVDVLLFFGAFILLHLITPRTGEKSSKSVIVGSSIHEKKLNDNPVSDKSSFFNRARMFKQGFTFKGPGYFGTEGDLSITAIPIINLVFFLSFIMVFIVPFFKIPFLLGVNTYRYLTFFEYSGAVLIALAFEAVFTIIIGALNGIVNNRYRARREKKNARYKSRDRAIKRSKNENAPQKHLILGIIMLMIFMLGFLDITYNDLTHSTYKNPLLRDAYFYNGWFQDDLEMIDWIDNNTDKGSRISMELSGDLQGFLVSGGHTALGFAMLSDRYFATGFTHPFFYKYEEKSTFIGEMLYGKNVSEYTLDELIFMLNLYNVEYIITITPKIESEIASLVLKSTLFRVEYNRSKYCVFHYLNASRSYLLDSDYLPLTERSPGKSDGIYSDFHMTEQEVAFRLYNIPPDGIIRISLHDYPNWRIYLDGIKIDKESDNEWGLITLKVPEELRNISLNRENGIEVRIVWEHVPPEILGNLTSGISWLFFIAVNIYEMVVDPKWAGLWKKFNGRSKKNFKTLERGK